MWLLIGLYLWASLTVAASRWIWANEHSPLSHRIIDLIMGLFWPIYPITWFLAYIWWRVINHN